MGISTLAPRRSATSRPTASMACAQPGPRVLVPVLVLVRPGVVVAKQGHTGSGWCSAGWCSAVGSSVRRRERGVPHLQRGGGCDVDVAQGDAGQGVHAGGQRQHVLHVLRHTYTRTQRQRHARRSPRSVALPGQAGCRGWLGDNELCPAVYDYSQPPPRPTFFLSTCPNCCSHMSATGVPASVM